MLKHDDFFIEMRNFNPKLLDYFSNNQAAIQQLIEYITKEPIDLEDRFRAYSLPYIAAEIFEFEFPPIINAFFSETD